MSNQLVEIKKSIARGAEESREALQSIGINPERFARVAMNVVLADTQHKIEKCTPESLRLAVLQCAQDGLTPGDEAAFIPRFNKNIKGFEAHYTPLYTGLARLAREAMPGLQLQVAVAYKGDHFEVKLGTESSIVHEPDPAVDRSVENIVAAYCCVRPPGAEGYEVEVMYPSEIEEIRNNAPSGNSPAWTSFYGEMAKKSVLRRALKRLPRRGASQLSAALSIADAPPDDPQEAVVTTVRAAPAPAPQPEAIEAEVVEPLDLPEAKPKESVRRKRTTTKAKAKKAAPEPEPSLTAPQAAEQTELAPPPEEEPPPPDDGDAPQGSWKL